MIGVHLTISDLDNIEICTRQGAVDPAVVGRLVDALREAWKAISTLEGRCEQIEASGQRQLEQVMNLRSGPEFEAWQAKTQQAAQRVAQLMTRS